ncbi:MAG: hypothetical protein V9G04_15550 [Nocardioides sp.]|jgi:hypothetical protein
MHRFMFLAAWLQVSLSGTRRRDERGDIPGWVMVTVMTAGLVVAIWQFAGPQLENMLKDALGKVSGR